MRLEFRTSTQIVFGPGVLVQAAELARPWGRRALVVTGKNTSRAGKFLGQLAAGKIETELISIEGEPSVDAVSAGVQRAREWKAEMVFGFGGGSAIDAAKAIAGLSTNQGAPLDYLEVVGKGQALSKPPLPWMAIPTTAGTGAEVTRNAVLSASSCGVKVSLRSPLLLAKVALVDPELTYGLPAEITAATGMDALTQLIEAYVCSRANPMTDALCVAGIPRVVRALKRVWSNPDDTDARADLSLGAMWSGMALANAGLGAVHGLASPIGGMFSVPHGQVCAALLAPVMEINLRALRSRAPESGVLRRYDEVGQWLTGGEKAAVSDGVKAAYALSENLEIPRLGENGIGEKDLPVLVSSAQKASSMKANPLVLTDAEVAEILTKAI